MTANLKKTFTNGSIKNLADYIMHQQYDNFTKVFVPFLVVGDPTPEDFIAIVKKILPYTDILELGIPFSDPVADGPTIQEANKRAFQAGLNRDRALVLIERIRNITDKPIVVLTYANILGVGNALENNLRRFKKAGIDGLIIADVPLEEAEPYQKMLQHYDLDLISLVTPLTDDQRLEKIINLCSGYLYYVSVLGITGARESIQKESLQKLKLMKEKIKGRIPLLVGFGISNEQQAKEYIDYGADGVIVGSAIIKIVEEHHKTPDIMLDMIEGFCKKIKMAIKAKKKE
jgi:tryptophan synthase alpha chain